MTGSFPSIKLDRRLDLATTADKVASRKQETGNRKLEEGKRICVCVCVCVCVCTISLTENHFGGDVLGGAEDLLVGELARLAVDESFV